MLARFRRDVSPAKATRLWVSIPCTPRPTLLIKDDLPLSKPTSARSSIRPLRRDDCVQLMTPPRPSARLSYLLFASAHQARLTAISTCDTSGGSVNRLAKPSKAKTARHTVVIRSTILPGTMHKIVIPTLEEFSGKKAGVDFGVCNNPEFLREGTAVKDFRSPPKTVIGELDKASGDLVATLYEKLEAPLIRTSLETAEMVKYVDNSWHALKIGFANEIGNLCKSLELDAHEVMKIFCQDRKLNISSAYLLPGFAFGGSCLPKDLRALSYQAKLHDLQLPILTSILPSNEMQIARGLQLITAKGHTRVGILGFSFKAGTDDLRESPLIEVIERLLGKGYDLRIYDRNVNIASLVGANRDFILNHIPHISKLMVGNIDAVLNHAQTVVIGNKDPDFKAVPARLRDGQFLVDFVRIVDGRSNNGKYDGICW